MKKGKIVMTKSYCIKFENAEWVKEQAKKEDRSPSKVVDRLIERARE